MEWDGQGITGTSLLSKLFCDSKISVKPVVAEKFESQESSIADPDVFGPHGSGSISTRYGSGSGSFYNQTKIVRKTLISTVL
jgi:hypothetical protein